MWSEIIGHTEAEPLYGLVPAQATHPLVHRNLFDAVHHTPAVLHLTRAAARQGLSSASAQLLPGCPRASDLQPPAVMSHPQSAAAGHKWTSERHGLQG